MHGESRGIEHARYPDLSPREYAVLVPVVALIVAIGVYPKPFLDRIEPAAERHAQLIQQEPPAPVVRAGGE
jgi:NADH-quinone oxidoreductase subunit M